MNRETPPQGVESYLTLTQRLYVTEGRLRRLMVRTPLWDVSPLTLGRGVGTFRLWPFLSVPYLRQITHPRPAHLEEWTAALVAVLGSAAWAEVMEGLRLAADDQGVLSALRSPTVRPLLANLCETTLTVLAGHQVSRDIDIEEFIIDAIDEDPGDSIILLGATHRPYRLATAVLTAGGLAHEKQAGMLMATRFGDGVSLDAWPLLMPEWQIDPRARDFITPASGVA